MSEILNSNQRNLNALEIQIIKAMRFIKRSVGPPAKMHKEVHICKNSKIDSTNLKTGMDYQALKNVVVIFIMTRDPLGANRMLYTIESRCKELPDLPYDDGAKTIFLYTKGTEGNPREELKELLLYMENSCEENAKSDTLKKMHQMMRHVKSNEEVSIEYMKIFEREKMIREEGQEEQARQNACKFFENGASYELVRASITLLSDEELQAIYNEVKNRIVRVNS